MARHRFILLFASLLFSFNAFSQEALTLALTGDVMMGTDYSPDGRQRLPVHEGQELFRDAAPLLRGATLAAGNLEGTLCVGGETQKKGEQSYAFRTPPAYAPFLKKAGYDFMSVANNHAFDFGLSGVKQTEAALKEQGIVFAGLKGRTTTAIVERNGMKIGFCAFGHNGYTLLHNDLRLVRQIITSLVDRCHIVVVSFHGGAEGMGHDHVPDGKEMFLGEDRGNLRRFAHFCIDAGADVVYGHGPHLPRALELYKEHLIAYSLGNFCTPCGMSLSGQLGHAPVLTLRLNSDGCFLDGRIHSFIQQKGVGPRSDGSHSVARRMARLTQQDFPKTNLRIADNGEIKRKHDTLKH